MRHSHSILVLLLVGLWSCGTQETEPEATCAPREVSTSLIDNTLWETTPPERDPFPDRPEVFTCEPEGLEVEGDIFEANTDQCEYVSVSQALKEELRPCDTVQVVISYFPLFSVERAEAHVALAFGQEVIWEERLPIPSPNDLIIARFQPDKVWEAGTEVNFHLHNHGVNDWRLIDISAEPGDP